MQEKHRLWKDSVLFYLGGMTYVTVEFLWRGYSHCSMFVVGGADFLLMGKLPQKLPLALRMFCGAAIITASELVSGALVNEYLGLHVWDYSKLPFNYRGQISLVFSLLWVPLSAMALLENRFFRKKLFHEPMPKLIWA